MLLLAKAVFNADYHLVRPAPIAFVPGVAAFPVVPGGRGRSVGAGGRGRGAGVPMVPAMAPISAAPMPSSLADEDVRLGISDWLSQMALPVELSSVPRDRRAARLDVDAR